VQEELFFTIFNVISVNPPLFIPTPLPRELPHFHHPSWQIFYWRDIENYAKAPKRFMLHFGARKG